MVEEVVVMVRGVSSGVSSEVYSDPKAAIAPLDSGDQGSWESSGNGLRTWEGASRTGGMTS